VTTDFIEDYYAPIVLVAFNRPEHFKKTLSALAQNECARDSTLYCYIDGATNSDDSFSQKIIVDVINGHRKDFKNVYITQRQINFGLAKNIIEAVTEIVSKYGKVIVVEDDIVTSNVFLTFMNDALRYYEKEDRVWHISAHSEINLEQRQDEIFLWRCMICWGWATWNNRWQYFQKDSEQLIEEFNEQMIEDFDLNGSDVFWNQVLDNAQNKIDTWAIFWYATIFKHGGLCVNPYFSHAANIGFDGTGVHRASAFQERRMERQPLNHFGKFIGKAEIFEDLEALSVMRKAYLPRKNARYYVLKVVTLFVSKETLKKIFYRS